MLRKRLKSLAYAAFAACALLAPKAPVQAAGTLPLALVQQSDVNGVPLAGCIVSFFVAGTVSAPQNAFADFGLTQSLGNSVTCDQSGRVPMFWLADGLIHVRLTDSSGVVQVDTTMQVLGPSSGGGGGGGTIDPTTIAQTGDTIFRFDGSTRTGWVIENGTTIGSASSGASQRANADTQNLYVYLWTNCANATSNRHCPVVGGLGANALADFNANKPITLPDMRGQLAFGRDCMGTTCAGRLLASNVTSSGDGVDSVGGSGGIANQPTSITIGQSNIPSYNLPILNFNDPGHSHIVANFNDPGHRHTAEASDQGYSVIFGATNTGLPTQTGQLSVGGFPFLTGLGGLQNLSTTLTSKQVTGITFTIASAVTGITFQIGSGGSGSPINWTVPVMDPFVLVTFFMKL